MRLASARRAIRGFLGRLSLRARLLLGLVLVASLGFILADVIVYSQIRSYLSTQLDQELTAVQPGRLLVEGNVVEPAVRTNIPPDTYIAVYALTGSSPTSMSDANASLNFPAALQRRFAAEAEGLLPYFGAVPGATNSGSTQLFFTANLNSTGTLKSGPYRALAQLEVTSLTSDPVIAVIAVPLTSLNGTLDKLLALDIGVSLVVLAALGAIGYVVVRIGMRPLAAIEETAGAIAGGDLTRRVERDDAGSEVGRLGASLNVMLSQIERAFAERAASENRLRQFLADASHELRTPVTSIRGYSELFRRGAVNTPEDLALAMRRIEDEAVRMGGLVDDLLLLARLDQGRPLERAPVDLSAIAMDCAADAQARAPESPVTVAVEESVTVEGDEQRLRQLVTNLVSNAIVHTAPGTAIEVRLETEGDLARLVVADEGEGIAPEHAEHVFERFYRADPSRVRDSGGSGLGLSIVASIAQAHGGRARLSDGPHRGACVVVELPRRLGPLATPPPVTFSANDGFAVGDEVREETAPRSDEVVADLDDTSRAR